MILTQDMNFELLGWKNWIANKKLKDYYGSIMDY